MRDTSRPSTPTLAESPRAAVDGPARLRAIAEVDLLARSDRPAARRQAWLHVGAPGRRIFDDFHADREDSGLLLAQRRQQRCRLEAVRSHQARARERDHDGREEPRQTAALRLQVTLSFACHAAESTSSG